MDFWLRHWTGTQQYIRAEFAVLSWTSCALLNLHALASHLKNLGCCGF